MSCFDRIGFILMPYFDVPKLSSWQSRVRQDNARCQNRVLVMAARLETRPERAGGIVGAERDEMGFTHHQCQNTAGNEYNEFWLTKRR